MKRLAALGLILFLLAGCTRQEPSPSAQATEPRETVPVTAEAEEPEQLLRFSCQISPEYENTTTAFVHAPQSEILEGNVFRKITYYGPSEVLIYRNGRLGSFSQALQGALTLNQLLYEARLDAGNGFCTESRESTNGLSHFYFDYGDYGLWICDDVYETPDGAQWKIEEVQFFAGNGLTQVDKAFGGFVDRKSNICIDYEDWGLSFTLSDVTRAGATLKIQQSGGQQQGPLSLHLCTIRPADRRDFRSVWSEYPSLPIQMDGTTEYRLDFSSLKQNYCPEEAYALQLWIFDEAPEEQDPMRRDFSLNQWYTVPIPMGFEY